MFCFSIRAQNNNPTAQRFKSTFRLLLGRLQQGEGDLALTEVVQRRRAAAAAAAASAARYHRSLSRALPGERFNAESGNQADLMKAIQSLGGLRRSSLGAPRGPAARCWD